MHAPRCMCNQLGSAPLMAIMPRASAQPTTVNVRCWSKMMSEAPAGADGVGTLVPHTQHREQAEQGHVNVSQDGTHPHTHIHTVLTGRVKEGVRVCMVQGTTTHQHSASRSYV